MAQCADCGIERERLHRHHVIPKHMGGADVPENLIRICPNCHDDRHQVDKPWMKAQTPEVKAKRSGSRKAWWEDPANAEKIKARNAKISATKTGKSYPRHVEAMKRAASEGRWSGPRLSRQGRPIQTPESRAKIAEAQRRRWAEGKYRDRTKPIPRGR